MKKKTKRQLEELAKEIEQDLFIVEVDIYRCTDYKIQYFLGRKDALEQYAATVEILLRSE